MLVERHSGAFDESRPSTAPSRNGGGAAGGGAAGGGAAGRGAADGGVVAADGNGLAAGDAAIRPERFARLVTLASILIDAGREGRRLSARDLCERLGVTEIELREDISVLNVVNFGAGTYVLYAEIADDGTIEVDPEPYGDSFARPARLLPVEAKALVAAIDLIGEHIPEGSLTSVREKVVAALGEDPAREGLQIASATGDDPEIAAVVSRAITARHRLSFEYYKPNEDEFTTRTVEPYALTNGKDAWYVVCYDPVKNDVRHFRLDRFRSATVTDEAFEPRADVDPAAEIDGWLRTGEVAESRRARVWISPERARWVREERTVIDERPDGSIIVDWGFKGVEYLVREVLKEAGDAVVLEPADAREAVLEAARALQDAAAVPAAR
jgi:proteasome accessory factor C